MDFRYDDDQAAVIELRAPDPRRPLHPGGLAGRGEEWWPALRSRAVEQARRGRARGARPCPRATAVAELGFLELAGVLEQVGRTTAPVPLLEVSVLGALPIVQFGSEAQKASWLPRIARGEAIVTTALVERFRAIDDPGTTASPDGQGGWTLDGEKICVPAGPIADAILVPARVGDDVAVFLVETTADGLERGRPEDDVGPARVRAAARGRASRRGFLARRGSEGPRRRPVDRSARDRRTRIGRFRSVARRRCGSRPSTPRRASSSTSRSRRSRPSASALPMRSSTPRRSG